MAYEVPQDKNIINATIEEEMQKSYIDYSMSVIISRALPDVRDGLKPVQRRILYGMNELGLHYSKKENKSSRIIGEVMGKFHPHGDSSIYMALVRMAQVFSLRYPLVNGQGNFGNIDMGPAAMRYTEAKLRKISEEMLHDIKKDTVDFVQTYDNNMLEPTVLPSRIPNLLLNGAQGIAVGLATSIPPHNLTEVMNAVIALVEDPDITIEGIKEDKENGIEAKKGLLDYVIAPDFPTAGSIFGYRGIKEMYLTGRGRCILRGKVETVIATQKNEKNKIIIHELPYQVSRKDLIEKIVNLVKEKRLEGIFGLTDESGKSTRIVIELKKEINPEIIINQLYKYTTLQISVSGNFVALVNQKPMQLNLKQILHEFVKHREDVIIRRTKFDLKKAQDRIHILEGLKIALDNIDRIIEIIRGSHTTETAKETLIEEFSFTEVQATAILSMRLSQLTGLEREKLLAEIEELKERILDLEDILARRERRLEIIKTESLEIIEKYGDERTTEIIHDADDLTVEDMISDDEMIVTVSHAGYIKRMSVLEFKTQGRGGVGSKGAKSKDEDFTQFIFFASNHDYLMFFTDKGKVYWKKVWQIPEMSKTAKGKPIVNFIENLYDEKIKSILKVRDFEKDGKYLIMTTKKGIIKKTELTAYSRPNKSGIIAINLRDDDELLETKITDGNTEILLGTKMGYANRFNEDQIRVVGRNSIGVKGINLRENDEVVGMIYTNDPEDTALIISSNGYGKRAVVNAFRETRRGSKGVRALNLTEKTGYMISLLRAGDDMDLMIMTKEGLAIRQSVENIRVMGRNTQGVKLISLRESDSIADNCIVPQNEQEDELEQIDENAQNSLEVENIEIPIVKEDNEENN